MIKFKMFPGALVCVGGQVGHQSSLNNSPSSTRIEFEAARTAAGVGGGRVVAGLTAFSSIGARH